ncbi:FAM73A [Cichlidogyrus casuarinus]|uniref:FAM73A n=1 Tax=Cichlidogyrus casuarinus TaxID=1844966 RepID=A0ABD2QIZ8_9PLAT
MPFFKSCLLQLDEKDISCRKLRTTLFECPNDTDFLAKLIAVRAAFDNILSQDTIFEWTKKTGELTGARLLCALGAEHAEFVYSYNILIEKAKELSNSEMLTPDQMDLKSELKEHGISCENFYDLVLDYILVDAFELLSNPPNSILNVTQNRWLSDYFKKTTLDSTIWTILLAKRKLLGSASAGFFGHYYSLVGTFIGPLAWAFFGTDVNSQRLVQRIRDTLQAFLKDLFSFHQTCGKNPHSNIENLELFPEDSVSSLGEDDSTVILSKNDSAPITREETVKPVAFTRGMRYQTLPELSRDVYSSLIDCSCQINSILTEEMSRLGNSFPKDLSEIVDPPELEWIVPTSSLSSLAKNSYDHDGFSDAIQ